MALPVQYPIAFDRLWANGYDEYFIGRRDFNMYGDSFQPTHASEAPILHHTLTANLSAWLRAVPEFDIPNEMRPDPHVSSSNETRVHTTDWDRAESAAQWLAARKASGTTKPFALSVGFIIPHPVYTTSAYWYNYGVNSSRITMPQHFDVGSQPWPLDYDSKSKNVTWWPMTYWTDDEQKLVRHVYSAMAAETDAIFGQVLDALNATGFVDNTVVVLWSDHGDMQMTHWSWYKETVLEGASRVPLIIAGPGIAEGKIVTRATSLLDVFPTVMDLSQTPYPTGDFAPDGFSLVPDLQEDGAEAAYTTQGTATHPDYVITQWHGDHGNTGQFAVRQGDFKYIYYSPLVPVGLTVGDAGRFPGGTFTQPDASKLPTARQAQPGQAYSVLFNITADRDEMVDVIESNGPLAQQLHSILLAELGDPDAIDAEAKAWDKCMWAKWRGDIGHGNLTKVMEVMGNPGNRFWWVWRADPDKYMGLLTTWERSHGGPNMSACVDPFHTDNDDGPSSWDDDTAAAEASWTFPDPLKHWPLRQEITVDPEAYRRPLDYSPGAAQRIAWAESAKLRA